MRLTERDVRLVKDISLSHVLSRDQILSLGYFGSVSRANRRLRELLGERFLKVLEIPFQSQRIYAAGSRAEGIVGEKVRLLLVARSQTPRFLQHALAVTNVRVALMNRGYSNWKFEQQIRDSVRVGDKIYEIRPDGLITGSHGHVFVEADLGHVSRKNFAKKIEGYENYARSGRAFQIFKVDVIRVLVVTTGPLRLAHLEEIVRPSRCVSYKFTTFETLGAAMPGSWS